MQSAVTESKEKLQMRREIIEALGHEVAYCRYCHYCGRKSSDCRRKPCVTSQALVVESGIPAWVMRLAKRMP